MDSITALLQRVNAGEAGAMEALFSDAYAELRKLARSRLRDGGRDTVMNTTALVHESYLRIIKSGLLRADDRRAFFAYASKVMRSVIVDQVRSRNAERRGGQDNKVTLDTHAAEALPAPGDDVLNVHAALEALADTEPRLAKVIEMRYFGGFTETEIGDTLGIHERTVRRDCEKAQRLLAALVL
jgi:RNA polymerase sigma factor (TIGR02999 family)